MKVYETILYELTGNIAWITLNRPEMRNAMNSQMRSELSLALEQARDDASVYMIAITGMGDKAFCAGADISQFPNLQAHDQINRHGQPHPLLLIRGIPKPVIAMVNGLALGGGCELVLACDIAIASEKAQFGLPEVRVGVIPGGGGTQILPRLVGEKRAKEMIFSGRIISASEAYNIGLINQVVPPDKLRETTDKFIAELLKRSPVILKLAKLAINRSSETTLTSGLASERDLFALCFGTEDQKEGAKAFLEKREAKYKGR